jgi:ATP-dependent RNA helicase HelY
MRAHREVIDLEQRINGRTNTVARRFDRVCEVLTDLGYLEGKGDHMTVTDAATVLTRLYSESDLLAAQCIRDGIWSDLEPAELAGVASAVVFESRKLDDDEPVALPRGITGSTISTMLRMWESLHEVERRHQLSITRKPDPGFALVMQRWASGASLQTLLLSTDITAGDFVRWTRQTIDLLGQIAQATPREDPVHDRAMIAADLLNRGVVSYSSQI